MATTAVPHVAARPGAATPDHTVFALERRGIGAWLTTPDHKNASANVMANQAPS